jgi:hypothetical protein
MSQADRAQKVTSAAWSDGWNRDRMNETHRKGKRSAKKERRRARRRLDQILASVEIVVHRRGQP